MASFRAWANCSTRFQHTLVWWPQLCCHPVNLSTHTIGPYAGGAFSACTLLHGLFFRVPHPHRMCVTAKLLARQWRQERQLEVCILCQWHLCTCVRDTVTCTWRHVHIMSHLHKCHMWQMWHTSVTFGRDVCNLHTRRPCSYSAVLVLFPFFVPHPHVTSLWSTATRFL